MKPTDLLICIREDNYCIDTLTIIEHPKVDQIVEVKKVIKDEDGTWLVLKGYDVDMFDVNCFRKLKLEDINLLQQKLENILV